MSILNGIAGALGVGAGYVEGAWNRRQQEKLFEYQKDLQNKIFEREDNAVQRRAADLQAAGLSKTLAAGSGAGAGSVVSAEAPQDDTMSRLLRGIGLARAKAEVQNIESQTANNTIEARVKEDSLLTSQVSRARMNAQIALDTGRFELLGVEKSKGEQWINQSIANVNKINAEIQSIGYRNLFTQAQTSNVKALTSKYGQETVNLATQLSFLQSQIKHTDSLTERVQLESQSEKIRQDMMQAQLTGFLLDNERNEMENQYMARFGTKMPQTTNTFGLGTLAGGLSAIGNNVVSGTKAVWNFYKKAWEFIND